MEEVELPSFCGVLATLAGRATDPGMELCNLRVAQQLPRTERCLPGQPRRRMHRDLLRTRALCSPMASVVRGVRMERPLHTSPSVRMAKIRVSMLLVEAAHGCQVVKMLLLTLLGV